MDERLFKQRARENLAGNWALSIGVAAVAALLGGLVSGGSFLPDIKVDPEAIGRSVELWEGFRVQWNGNISAIIGLILGGVIELGYATFLLNQHDRKDFQFQDLFSQFDRFGQAFAQHFLRSLYVFLWGLLLIIPGIIADYSYSMTPFLMADNPDLTASEAIALSKRMMDGHKGALFCLELSLIGWTILAALTMNLGHLVLNPYRNAARAAFYRQLRADYVKQNNFY